MAKDKSETHYRFIRNGQYGWVSKTVWDSYGDKEKAATGFVIESPAPPEVKALQEKKAIVETTPPIEVKKLSKTAKKDEGQES